MKLGVIGRKFRLRPDPLNQGKAHHKCDRLPKSSGFVP